jgi:hypothetical protein
MSEKRKHIRTEFSGNVKLIHASFGELTVEMRDLSDGGIFLYVQNDVTLPVGTTVRVQSLDIEDAPVLAAEIVRREARGIALMFLEV